MNNPGRMIFSREMGGVKLVECLNGMEVELWTFLAVMSMKVFFLVIDGGHSRFMSTSDRAISAVGL